MTDTGPSSPRNDSHPPDAGRHANWTFLTNHAHVLIAISRNAELRQRDISELVGITQGAVQRILDDLETGGYIQRERVGRRNRYQVNPTGSLRHPLEQPHTIGELLAALDE